MLLVGRIGRAHGIGGEVSVSLLTHRTERLAPGAELFAEDELLVVAAARPHKDRWLVSFEGVSTRDRAEALRGRELRAHPIDDPDELWVHDLIGAVVVAGGVERGVVESVLDNPASDLLVLDTGHLVPARFVAAVEPGVRVEVDAPDGLFGDAEEAR